MKTSEFLKKRRKELGLTLKDVGDYIGVAEATVSRYESGNIANMGRDKIAKLSEILRVSPSVIAGYDDEINDSPDETELLQLFSALSEDNKKKVIEYALLLLKASN